MNSPSELEPTRRGMLQQSAGIASVLSMTGLSTGGVFAAEDNTIRVALVGCGGRGTGAAVNAIRSKNGPTKIVALADVFPEKLNGAFNALSKRYKDQIDLPEDRRFVGFDGYKKAIDCLRKGDLVILATPPAFRWVHFSYAIEKGINVFMEKPVSIDGPSSVKMFKLAEESLKQNLKVGVGLMCRHCNSRQELYDRIRRGEIGDLTLLRAYRMGGRTATDVSVRKPNGISELMYQIQRFHSFLWASGGAFSDYLIHNIDEACWMKDQWPVKVSGLGGRHFRFDPKTGEEWIDQNFDCYSAEYTFGDGTKLIINDRRMPGCQSEFATYAHGTKGSAIVSASGHWPSNAAIFNNQTLKGDRAWDSGSPGADRDPYQVEFDDLLAAIKGNKPYNETKRGTEASLVTAMGRKACHTGRPVTFEEMLKDDHDLSAGVEKLTLESEAIIKADKDGRYPIPTPGFKKREF